MRKLLPLLGLCAVGAALVARPAPTPRQVPNLNELKIAFFGSSVPEGQGATNKYGYASRYGALLARRAAAGQGAAWTTGNISVPGATR